MFCCEADPDITGLDRATGALRTSSEDAVARIVDLTELVAVTRTSRYLPTSAGTSTLVAAVARAIDVQLLATVSAGDRIEVLQLNHW